MSPEIGDFWCANESRSDSSTPSSSLRHVRRLAHRPTTTRNYLYADYVTYDVATRKTISIRDDQEEWIQDNHLNLSSFVQEKLDELIEERES